LSDSTYVTLSNGQKFEVSHKDLKKKFSVGKGTFGEVFEMIHTPTGIKFAVKV
jgi:hypothetical protein